MNVVTIALIGLALVSIIELVGLFVLTDKIDTLERRITRNAEAICKSEDRTWRRIDHLNDALMERLDPFLSTPEEEVEFVEALKELIDIHKEEEIEIVEVDPYLISATDYYFSHGLGCERYELIYHKPSNELRYITDENHYIVVDNVEEVIGDGLRFFGMRSGDSNVVYVRNLNFGADFRIVKVAE